MFPYSARVRREGSTGRALSCFWLGSASGPPRLMLVGELDLVTVDQARAAISDAQDEMAEVICDLGDVFFIDIAGLRILLDAADRARRTGGRLTIASCPAIVPRMLEALGVRDALEIRGVLAA